MPIRETAMISFTSMNILSQDRGQTYKILQQAWDLGVLVTLMMINEGGCVLLGDDAQRKKQSRDNIRFHSLESTLNPANTMQPVASGSQPTIYSRWVGIGLQKVR